MLFIITDKNFSEAAKAVIKTTNGSRKAITVFCISRKLRRLHRIEQSKIFCTFLIENFLIMNYSKSFWAELDKYVDYRAKNLQKELRGYNMMEKGTILQ